MTERKLYPIFGLRILSDVELPAPFRQNPESHLAQDVTIEFGKTPEYLVNPTIQRPRFQASPGECLLFVDSVARYHVTCGNRIVITPVPGASESAIQIFLLGSVFGALLHQRNFLVLHAGAIALKNAAIAFSGVSGTGKSTLTAGFIQRGFTFLADDVCAIRMEDGIPFVMPGFPRLKLWADVLKKLDITPVNPPHIRRNEGLEKFFIDSEAFCTEPVPLKKLFILTSSQTDRLDTFPLTGGDKIKTLVSNTYRKKMIRGFGLTNSHFQQCATLARSIAIHRIKRPAKGFHLDELMDMIEAVL